MKETMLDFDVKNFYFFYGPNQYINKKALVFNLYLQAEGPDVEFYKPFVYRAMPELEEHQHPTVIDLFCHTLLEVLRMKMDLFIHEFVIREEGDDYHIAIEFLEENTAEDAVILVSDWFKSINEGLEESFFFCEKFKKLRKAFYKSQYGNPSLYSLIESAQKNDIPVFHIHEENLFQWGYGHRQLRGNSKGFHTDSLRDSLFTTQIHLITEFLLMCGFPTPQSMVCFSENEVLQQSRLLGFPLVLKPVTGEKGKGVTTNIQSEAELKVAFQDILELSEQQWTYFEGVILQKQIDGHNHRLLVIDGKLRAAIKRLPAYVDADGKHSIEELIEFENKNPRRKPNLRSPLMRIKISNEIIEFLRTQNLSLTSIPKKGERIFLNRVATIQSGGYTIDASQDIHPDNVKLAESLASFLKIKCLGIDVLTQNLKRSWRKGNFGIIEIAAQPELFTHSNPAEGQGQDVAQTLLFSHFEQVEKSRIPIIAGNAISQNLTNMIYGLLQKYRPESFMGALTREGVFFNGHYFFKNTSHDQNVKIILRHPKTTFAVFNHHREDIYNYGFFHDGADILILDHPNWAEESLKEMLLPGGCLIEVNETKIHAHLNGQKYKSVSLKNETEKDQKIAELVKALLPALLAKYD